MVKKSYPLLYQYQCWILTMIVAFCLHCGQVSFHTSDAKISDNKYSSTVSKRQSIKNNKSNYCKGVENCGLQNESFPFTVAAVEETPGYMEEHFTILGRNDLEIVLVIDNSGSMDSNLKKLGSNILPLLSHVKDKKWRMVFITVDHGRLLKSSTPDDWEKYMGNFPRYGKFMFLENNGEILNQKILTKNTSQYQQIFEDTITRESPSECSLPPSCLEGSNEQPLRSFLATILRSQTNQIHQRFFQPDTDTVVVIITDEDERVEDPKTATTAEEVIAEYNRVFKGQNKRLFGFSVSIQDKYCLEQESFQKRGLRTLRSSATYGRRVGRLAELTANKEGNVSICSKDYGAPLERISLLTRRLVHSLALKRESYFPQTVQVSLDPHQPHVQWELRQRKIVFSNDIQSGTKVKVNYQYKL